MNSLTIESAIREGLGDIANAVRGILDDPLDNSLQVTFKIGLPTNQTKSVILTPQFQSLIQGDIMSESTLRATQDVVLTPVFKDKKRNVVDVENIQWFIDNPNLVALTPSADGRSCTCSAVGPLGQALVSLTADGLVGEDEQLVSGSHTLNIISGAAVEVEITPSTPTEQT